MTRKGDQENGFKVWRHSGNSVDSLTGEQQYAFNVISGDRILRSDHDSSDIGGSFRSV
jgi:hypothetical protein